MRATGAAEDTVLSNCVAVAWGRRPLVLWPVLDVSSLHATVDAAIPLRSALSPTSQDLAEWRMSVFRAEAVFDYLGL